jgi:general secretion pathway protein E
MRWCAWGVPACSTVAAGRRWTPRLTEWLAGRSHLPYLRIDPLKVDVGRVADVMSVQYAKAQRAAGDGGRHRGGRHQPSPSTPAGSARSRRTRAAACKLVVANPDDLRRYTTEFYALARSVRAAQKSGEVATGASFEQLVELGRSNKQLDANDQGVVQVVDWLWQYAFDQRASDIHLEPRRDMGAIRFRIDGVLHTVYQVPLTVMAAMTSRIKLLGRMDVVERAARWTAASRPRPDLADKPGGEVEMRLSTLPTAFGEKMVMRIFDPETAVKNLAGWASAPRRRALAGTDRAAARHHPGHRPHRQRQDHHAVQHAQDAGHRRGQRLHHRGPDRDDRAGLQPDAGAAAAGHRLCRGPARADAAGPGHHHGRRDPRPGHRRDGDPGRAHRPPGLQHLHTNDAAGAITRLADLGVPSYLISATVIGVLAQRLARTLCPACKVRDEADHARDPGRSWPSPGACRAACGPTSPVGCLECRNTGYRGRAGLYELLLMTDAARAAVHPQLDAAALRRQA